MERSDVHTQTCVWILQTYPVPTVVTPRLIYYGIPTMKLEPDAVVIEPLPLHIRYPRNTAK
jgi:hypothetical protein